MRYFDNNATTRVAPEAVAAMLPFLTERWGNPSSGYRFGHDLAEPLIAAREHVAALIGASPDHFFFTSGGTESINTALQSALRSEPDRKRIVITGVEHPATLNFARLQERNGYEVVIVPVDSAGQLDLNALEKAVQQETAIVSAMWANNETGMLFPIREIAEICRKHDAPLHTDAVQAAGKVPLDVRTAVVDFLSLAAHKLHGPKGVGLLYVRPGVSVHPVIVGGGQERGWRGGTENVAGIVGFGAAALRSMRRLDEMNTRVRSLRDRLERAILERISGTSLNGLPEPRLPNTSNIAFDGIEAEGLMLLLDAAGICVSTGSACSAGSHKPSHVLTAMGCSPGRARSSVRFSLGVDNTDEDVDVLLAKLPAMIERLRAEFSSR